MGVNITDSFTFNLATSIMGQRQPGGSISGLLVTPMHSQGRKIQGSVITGLIVVHNQGIRSHIVGKPPRIGWPELVVVHNQGIRSHIVGKPPRIGWACDDCVNELYPIIPTESINIDNITVTIRRPI
jgi:hypothetical protein